MNQIVQAFIFYLCVSAITCEWFARGNTEDKVVKQNEVKVEKPMDRSMLLSKLKAMLKIETEPKLKNTTAEALKREKRQIPQVYAGGIGMGYGAYDYNDYYGDYVSDYNYDYYDWVCTDTSCQLCDILTSECCNPDIDINCFLPDSCINNPCLAGGTCITATTIDNRPDFTCVCLPGLTGKYCQLPNSLFVGANMVAPIMSAVVPPPIPPPMPVPMPAPMPAPAPSYGQQAYVAPQANYAPQLQAPQAPQATEYSAPQASEYSAPQVQAPQGQFMGNQAPQGQNGQFMNNQGQNGQFMNNQGQSNGMRTLGARRQKCGKGMIFNSETGACAEFTLRRKVSN